MAPLTRSQSEKISQTTHNDEYPHKPSIERCTSNLKRILRRCTMGNSFTKQRSWKIKRLRGIDTNIEEPGSSCVPTSCIICGIESIANPFSIHCQHQFCFQCIKENMAELIKKQVETPAFQFGKILTKLKCPYSSCDCELSGGELTSLLGLDMVHRYAEWLFQTYEALYKPCFDQDSQKSRQPCTCSQDNPTAVLASEVENLNQSEAYSALVARGLKRTLKSTAQRRLLKAIGINSANAKLPYWVCISCDAAWCGACGLRVPRLHHRDKVHHGCKERESYELYRSLLAMEKSCKGYTEVLSTPKSPMEEAEVVVEVEAEAESEVSMGVSATETLTTEMVTTPTLTAIPAPHPQVSIWADGTGFGGNNGSVDWEGSSRAARLSEARTDQQVESAFGTLLDVLGKPQEEARMHLGFTRYVMLRVGGTTVKNLLYILVKNDSIADVSLRVGLYLKALSAIEVLAAHRETVPILTGRENEPTVDPVLRNNNNNNNNNNNENENVNEFSFSIILCSGKKVTTDGVSLVKAMANLHEQASMFLRLKPGGKEEKARQLAQKICECYNKLLSVSPSPAAKTLEEEKEEEEAVAAMVAALVVEDEAQRAALYKETLRPLQFKFVSMASENGMYAHYFRKKISSESVDSKGLQNRKRMTAISKEVASLSTSLPLEWESGVYIRVDEVRMDVMRALIIGPCDTPYQNGVFTFDIYLPSHYPEHPPKMQFLTTAGGTVRFNPNLYTDGKICLSLLGTWQGPRWIPGKSTLLQVLVSIQSLIFVKDPYYNEPGFELHKSDEAANRESAVHRKDTLSVAILGALEKPDPVFEDVILEHFYHKRIELAQQCDEWVLLAGQKSNEVRDVVNQIKHHLKRIQEIKEKI